MIAATVSSSLISLHPTHRLDARFWIKVLEAAAVENTLPENMIKRVQEAYGTDNPDVLKADLERLIPNYEKILNDKKSKLKEIQDRGW